MIQVVVARIALDSQLQHHIVVLREKDGTRELPILIGAAEAESILLQLKQIKPVRPYAHDLFKGMIRGLGADLKRVNVTKLLENTYYAELVLIRGDAIVQIDARPSDSIAIALRFDAPIFVTESLLQGENGHDTVDLAKGSDGDRPVMTPEELQHYIERLRPEDLGKFNP